MLRGRFSSIGSVTATCSSNSKLSRRFRLARHTAISASIHAGILCAVISASTRSSPQPGLPANSLPRRSLAKAGPSPRKGDRSALSGSTRGSRVGFGGSPKHSSFRIRRLPGTKIATADCPRITQIHANKEITYTNESYAIMGAGFEVYNDKGCGFLGGFSDVPTDRFASIRVIRGLTSARFQPSK